MIAFFILDSMALCFLKSQHCQDTLEHPLLWNFGVLNIGVTRPLVCLKLWYMLCSSVTFLFFILGTGNESLEQNSSDLRSCFVKLNLQPHTRTHTQMLTQQKHTGEPSVGLTWLQGAKGKNRLQVAKECLVLARSLQPEQVRPHASPSCTACPKCSSMHARLCKRYTI